VGAGRRGGQPCPCSGRRQTVDWRIMRPRWRISPSRPGRRARLSTVVPSPSIRRRWTDESPYFLECRLRSVGSVLVSGPGAGAGMGGTAVASSSRVRSPASDVGAGRGPHDRPADGVPVELLQRSGSVPARAASTSARPAATTSSRSPPRTPAAWAGRPGRTRSRGRRP
jgi:hypothetical protein